MEPLLISYDDFAKLDLRIGQIIQVKEHPNADKLLILQVKLAGTDEPPRQIVAGIKKAYENIATLVGREIVVLTNLEPRELRGETSQGMLLAASDKDGNLVLIQPDKFIAVGSKVS